MDADACFRVLVLVLLVVILILAALCLARGPWPAGGAPAHVGGAAAKAASRDKGKPSRGALVHEAPAPPDSLLASGLDEGVFPCGESRAFDLEAGAPRKTPALEGLYCGLRACHDKSRATLLTPEILGQVAEITSGGVYAWFILDSHEGCFALRAEPENGRERLLDVAVMIEWLRRRLYGSPPHKVKLEDWLAYLRGQGFTVRHGPLREDEVRFNLMDVTTPDERRRQIAALRSLPFSELARFDWSEYDAAAGRQACGNPRETAGDVAVDLETRKVSAPKVRHGLHCISWSHTRSYVTFHTHPDDRYKGLAFEPPSLGDMGNTLWRCAWRGQAFHLISAPEGTYMLRPSEALIAAYKRDPDKTRDNALSAYNAHLRCVGGVMVCAERAVQAMHEASFIAHFRPVPCRELSDQPNANPYLNSQNREERKAAHAEAAELTGAELLAANWSLVAIRGSAHAAGPGVISSTWQTADYRRQEKVVRPLGPGHLFGPPTDPESYGDPQVYGPIVVLFFPTEDEFPPKVPHAAVEAARRRADDWAWVALLSPTRVTVFRAGATDIEIHGPAKWSPASPP